MGLTATPLLCVSPAAAQDVAASAVAGQPSSPPVLAELMVGIRRIHLVGNIRLIATFDFSYQER